MKHSKSDRRSTCTSLRPHSTHCQTCSAPVATQHTRVHSLLSPPFPTQDSLRTSYDNLTPIHQQRDCYLAPPSRRPKPEDLNNAGSYLPPHPHLAPQPAPSRLLHIRANASDPAPCCRSSRRLRVNHRPYCVLVIYIPARPTCTQQPRDSLLPLGQNSTINIGKPDSAPLHATAGLRRCPRHLSRHRIPVLPTHHSQEKSLTRTSFCDMSAAMARHSSCI